MAGIYRKVFPVVSRDTEVAEGGVMPGVDFPVFDCDFGRVGIQICKKQPTPGAFAGLTAST